MFRLATVFEVSTYTPSPTGFVGCAVKSHRFDDDKRDFTQNYLGHY